MITEKFKGDDTELKMEAAGEPAFLATTAALDQFYDSCYSASDFLIALYDESRAPFTDRVPRESFVSFIKQALDNAPFTGSFESYILLLKAIFGSASEVLLYVPAAGKLEILVSAEATLVFNFEARDLEAGVYESYDIVTSDGDTIEFTGFSGISSEAQLKQLLSEVIPAGIFPDITLTVFTLFGFIGEDSIGDTDFIIDNEGNQLVFFELGA